MLVYANRHISVTHKMPGIHVNIDNKPLNQVTVAKYLAMFIYSNIKWDDHINKLVPNILAKIGILRSLRKIVPTPRLLNNCIQQSSNHTLAMEIWYMIQHLGLRKPYCRNSRPELL